MERLTQKVDGYYCSQQGSFKDLYDKLGGLEDLEEEIGLSVEEMAIVCKIIKNGSIYEDEDNNTYCYFMGELDFDFENHEIVLMSEYEDDYSMRMEEVGRFKITDYKTKYWLRKDKSE